MNIISTSPNSSSDRMLKKAPACRQAGIYPALRGIGLIPALLDEEGYFLEGGIRESGSRNDGK
jgi:hypothetical protein